nr:IncF plasmid conjugative transfer pilus assembly protein TraC [Escherichia coli]
MVDFLKTPQRAVCRNTDHPQPSDEMIVLFDQYTANGTYGQYQPDERLADDAKWWLELGGLEDRPSPLLR